MATQMLRTRTHARTAANQRAARARPALLLPAGSGLRFARWLHEHGPQASGPFVVVDCSTLPRDRLEAALLLLGAIRRFEGRQRVGHIRAAHKGTLFLERIEALSRPLQRSVARLLERGAVRAVGATRPERVDVHVFVASARNLECEAEAHRLDRELVRQVLGAADALPAFFGASMCESS